MRFSCLIHPMRFPKVRIAFVTILTLLFCGWNNCTAIIGFNSCSTVPQPVIVSVSPDTISDDESVPLTVNGTEFIPQSEIMWNRNALQTTFIDSRHLQAMITKQIFESFGGSVANPVQISVSSSEPIGVVGCPSSLTSGTVVLFIN